MQPIFKEYIQFLKDKTNNDTQLDILQEGYYWLDNQIIKTFDSEGKIHKVLRVNISNDLDITITGYKKSNIIPIDWYDTIKLYNNKINNIESDSIALLSKYVDIDRTIIDTNSTGKDSMVKTHLAQKAGLKFKTYFNCTTCDVADSNIMAKNKQYEFTYPDTKYKGFYDWVEKENIIPSRLNRGCCRIFKEEPTIQSFNSKDKLLFLFGMRNDESSARSGYTDEWKNEKWGNRDWIGILPIRTWDDLTIWLYILRECIEINSKYKKGYSRVGCGIVCPNYGKSTWVLDKYWYLKMFDRWQNILRNDFLNNYKWISVHCTLQEYLQGAWTGGLLRENPSQEVVQEFAEYKGISIDVAEKYFEKYCMNDCRNSKGKLLKIKDKDTLAMNLKMNGRNIEKFMCKKCLMKHLGLSKDQWYKYIEDFKNTGCSLF